MLETNSDQLPPSRPFPTVERRNKAPRCANTKVMGTACFSAKVMIINSISHKHEQFQCRVLVWFKTDLCDSTFNINRTSGS